MISLSVKVFFSARWRDAIAGISAAANAGHDHGVAGDRSQGDREHRAGEEIGSSQRRCRNRRVRARHDRVDVVDRRRGSRRRSA